jgi:hypothetical protein
MGDRWLVARVDAIKLDGHDRAALIELVAKASGLPVAEIEHYVKPTVVISQDESTGAYSLHISRMVHDGPDGKMIIDHAAGDVWSEPMIFPLPSVPDWVLAAHQAQIKIGDN